MTDDRHKTAALAEFAAYMSRRSMRKTPERLAIYERALSMAGHFDTEALHKAMDDSDYHVSRATVYNTVNLLVEAGLLARHKFAAKHAQYEHVHAPSHHHHLVCTQCGKVKELVAPDVDNVVSHLDVGSFTPTSVELNVMGLCRSCVKKNKRAEKALKKEKLKK